MLFAILKKVSCVGYLCWVIKLVITISTVKGVVHFQIEIS